MHGDQWDCGCGWSNFFMRRRCRNCGLPSGISVGARTAEEVTQERHRASLASRGTGERTGRPDAGKP